jgi:hypothetical protein
MPRLLDARRAYTPISPVSAERPTFPEGTLLYFSTIAASSHEAQNPMRINSATDLRTFPRRNGIADCRKTRQPQ